MALDYQALDESIAKFEGFYSPGTIAQRQNNPGDIVYGTFAFTHGATGVGSKGIAIFPDAATGWTAEDHLVADYAAKGATIESLISAWAPANAPGNTPEATNNYINEVASDLGVSRSTPVSSLTGATSAGSNTAGSGSGSVFSNPFTSFSWSRVSALILGLIAVGAGLLLFKPVQEATVKLTETASKAALAA